MGKPSKRWRRNEKPADRGDNFRLREAKLSRALDAATPMEPTRCKQICPPWYRTTRANKPRTKTAPQPEAGT